MWKFFHIWAIFLAFANGFETDNPFAKVFWAFIVVVNLYFLVEYDIKNRKSP